MKEFFSPKSPIQLIIVITVIIIVVYFISVVLAPHLKTLGHWVFGANTNKIPESRKRELEASGQDLYDSIYSQSLNVSENQLKDILSYTDAELTYFNDYYNSKVTTNNLAYDLDWEFLFWMDADEKLLKRISDLGLPGKTGYLDPDNKWSQSKPLGIAIAGVIGLALIAVVITKGNEIKAAVK